MKFLVYIYIFLPLLIACKSKEIDKNEKHKSTTFKKVEFKDVFFNVEENVNYIKLEVVHPLNVEEKEVYILHDSSFIPPDTLKANHFIQVPVNKVACLSTSHIGFIEAIDKAETIKAALNPNLIYSDFIQMNYQIGNLISLGGAKMNMEALVNLNIDIVFASVFDAASMKKIDQIRNLGIKVVLVSEYLEEKPLEKVKWIDFFARFYDEQAQHTADSVYKEISESYNEVKTLVANKEKPKVITGLPWKGNWYVPSGNSYQTNFIKDAGAQYIFEDESFEEWSK